ncbi:unnamed protein product, partial [Phaeothamnion confervicola]
YRTSGAALLITMAMNGFTPHLYWFVERWWHRRRWHKKKNKCHSQDELNRLAMGSSWEASVRYAEMSVTWFVCYVYSGGMPLLLPIAAGSFFIYYWVEKFLFLRYYRTPPHYSQRLVMSVVDLIPYALFLHVICSLWMYGNGSIFATEEDAMSYETYVEPYDALGVLDEVHSAASKVMVVPLVVLGLFLV